MQVGGTLASLSEHIALATDHPLLGGEIDYKLALSPGPRSLQAAQESGFTMLSVTLCKVLACLHQCHRHAWLFLKVCFRVPIRLRGSLWLLVFVAHECKNGASYRRTCLVGCYRGAYYVLV